MNRRVACAIFAAVRNHWNSPWASFGAKAAAWLLFAGLAWLYPFVFLDEPIDFLVPTILLAAGLHLGFFEATKMPGRRGVRIKRVVAAALIVASFWTALPGRPEAQMPWQPYSEAALMAARAAKRPVMIYFHADWCTGCHELERKVFSRKKIVEAASGFVLLKADLTDSDSPSALRLAMRYRIDVFPTVIFLGADGDERVNLRLLGSEGREQFLRRLQAAR